MVQRPKRSSRDVAAQAPSQLPETGIDVLSADEMQIHGEAEEQSSASAGPAIHTEDDIATTEVVTVGCKLPCGLILHVDHMTDFDEPMPGIGMRTVKRAVPRMKNGQIETYELKGCAVPNGQTHEHPIIGGYALTSNIPADFFDAWMKANADSELVKNKIVFAHRRDTVVSAMAKEYKSVRSGLEPITPPVNGQPGDPRLPKRTSAHVGRIEQGSRI